MLPCNIFCYYALFSWLCRDDCFTLAAISSVAQCLANDTVAFGDPEHFRVIKPTGPPILLSTSGTKDGINAYVDRIMTYHNYPDLVGYERYGNGYTTGDAWYITVASVADELGRGGLHIRFPPRRNPLKKNDKAKLGDVDGLYHPCNFKQWDGYWLWVFPLRANVEFPPGPRENVYKLIYVPKARALEGYFLDYTSDPHSRTTFVIEREVSWRSVWKPCDSFSSDEPEHTDL
jgi:hypothetical protein